MERLWTECDYVSLNKHGEQLCGDRVEIMHDDVSDATTLVLADGLGSGVKANILSTLTSKILCTMMANGLSVTDCVETMASTLPVCQVRQVAYSTFSIMRTLKENQAELIQYDNPLIILLRNGKSVNYHSEQSVIDGKQIFESSFPLELHDTLIAISDGAVYAGVGNRYNFGWQRDNIIEFLEKNYRVEYSAKQLALLLSQACNELYGGRPGDDTTVAVIKMRKRYSVNLMIGPPQDKADDAKMMEDFFSSSGSKIICGGTTAQIAARYLGKKLQTSLHYLDSSIPPMSQLEGVDLVTEGVVTISRVLEQAQDCLHHLDDPEIHGYTRQDAASQICRELIREATDVRFLVGRAINPAHQDTDLPINFSIKLNLINELSKCLTELGKEVNIVYY